jgi:hypothetical protein
MRSTSRLRCKGVIANYDYDNESVGNGWKGG